MLSLVNVSGKLQVILDENQENPNVVNRNTPKISFNLQSTKDKPAKNDSEILDSLSKSHSSESHSKSRSFIVVQRHIHLTITVGNQIR